MHGGMCFAACNRHAGSQNTHYSCRTMLWYAALRHLENGKVRGGKRLAARMAHRRHRVSECRVQPVHMLTCHRDF